MDNTNAQTKVPFYMTYPMQNLYLMEMEYEKDMERMKELYPKSVRQLMPYVEEFCDGLEYEGSRIYDENPDARMMREACEKLYAQIQDQQSSGGISADEEKKGLAAASLQNREGVRCSAFSLNPPEGWELPPERSISSEDMKQPVEESELKAATVTDELRDLVGLLFADEIYRRRCRHRRCRRWW